jgi:virulence-associated protein VapD
MNNAPIQFNTLTRDHPQLTEKSLIDFVNGLEVIDDHIRLRETSNNKFISRVWGDLNGENALRQQTIDQHVTESLKTVSTWLQCLQQQQIQSDLAIAKIGEKLLETRQGIMVLLEKHNNLQYQVDEILISMDSIKEKYSQLSIRIEQVDDGRLATQHLEYIFDKWAAGRLNHYPMLIRLFLVFDELYWGDFGNYCRQFGLVHREIQRLIEQVHNKALIQLKNDGANNQIIDWQADIKYALQNLSIEHREVIVYLTDQAIDETMPIIWSLNKLANNPYIDGRVQNIKVPIILTMQNAINRFSADFAVRYNHE